MFSKKQVSSISKKTLASSIHPLSKNEFNPLLKKNEVHSFFLKMQTTFFIAMSVPGVDDDVFPKNPFFIVICK